MNSSDQLTKKKKKKQKSRVQRRERKEEKIDPEKYLFSFFFLQINS